MKVVAHQIWNEPAVFIGLLTSIALVVGAFLTDTDWGWETVVAVSAPFVSALGIRQAVTPVAKLPPPASASPPPTVPHG